MTIQTNFSHYVKCLRHIVLCAVVLGIVIPAAYAQRGEVFPDSDRRLLHWRDLEDMSCWNLEIARNEIFARRGRFFDRQDLRRYFEQFPWYNPYTWNPSLNRTESENIAIIQNVERRQRCR